MSHRRRIHSLPLFRAIAVGAFALLGGCSLFPKSNSTATEQADAKKQKDEKQAVTAATAPTPRISPSTHLAAGQMLEKQGDIKGAIAQYERAIAANPRLAAAYNRLGNLYQRLGRHGEAENIYRHGIEADPASAGLHNNLGYCLLVQNRFSGAEGSFRDALRVNAEFKRARMNLAITLAQTQRYADSLEEFRKVVPADVAYANIGVICLRAKDFENAEKALRESLAINSNAPQVQKQLDEVVRFTQASVKPSTGGIQAVAPPQVKLAGPSGTDENCSQQ